MMRVLGGVALAVFILLPLVQAVLLSFTVTLEKDGVAAGAVGLMQLMPETAKRMATDQGLGFEVGRLTTDPTFNARLGSAYLAQLVAVPGEHLRIHQSLGKQPGEQGIARQ